MTAPPVQPQYFALNDLDRKLEKYLDKDNGVFFEAGANDGMNQSNTLYFERNRGWHGVLVEPIPARFVRCRDLRGRVSQCVWAALVPPNWSLPFVELTYCDLMTVTRSELAQINQDHHVNAGVRFLGPDEQPFNFFAPARTISSILEEAEIRHIDLFSLDLEGFECAALTGLDLTRFDVAYFCIECIECRNLEAIKGVLGEAYEVIDQLSGHDYLFRKRRSSIMTVPMVNLENRYGYGYLSLDSILWPSLRADQVSAWHGHVAFAHWLVQVAAPGIVVELGTHNGVSFAAFCNSAARCGLTTKLYAVDSWMGDEHAGFYTEEAFHEMVKFNAQFDRFATLMRCYFDDALDNFEDGSIDILHIDGLHTYDAVKHDFESWQPKLSDRAIVLFHDTEIHAAGFGVWKFWGELCDKYPSFNFNHSAGLGVLAVGSAVNENILRFCSESDDNKNKERECFAQASLLARQSGLKRLEDLMRDRLASIVTTGQNVALNKVAWQSSAVAGCSICGTGGNNGIKTGKHGFHTMLEKNPWWMVDLGVDDEFDEIIIYNRLDSNCKYRSSSLTISLSTNLKNWNLVYSHDGTTFGGADGLPLRVSLPKSKARFVRLELLGVEFFHLDEVEIYKH